MSKSSQTVLKMRWHLVRGIRCFEALEFGGLTWAHQSPTLLSSSSPHPHLLPPKETPRLLCRSHTENAAESPEILVAPEISPITHHPAERVGFRVSGLGAAASSRADHALLNRRDVPL